MWPFDIARKRREREAQERRFAEQDARLRLHKETLRKAEEDAKSRRERLRDTFFGDYDSGSIHTILNSYTPPSHCDSSSSSNSSSACNSCSGSSSCSTSSSSCGGGGGD